MSRVTVALCRPVWMVALVPRRKDATGGGVDLYAHRQAPVLPILREKNGKTSAFDQTERLPSWMRKGLICPESDEEEGLKLDEGARNDAKGVRRPDPREDRAPERRPRSVCAVVCGLPRLSRALEDLQPGLALLADSPGQNGHHEPVVAVRGPRQPVLAVTSKPQAHPDRRPVIGEVNPASACEPDQLVDDMPDNAAGSSPAPPQAPRAASAGHMLDRPGPPGINLRWRVPMWPRTKRYSHRHAVAPGLPVPTRGAGVLVNQNPPRALTRISGDPPRALTGDTGVTARGEHERDFVRVFH